MNNFMNKLYVKALVTANMAKNELKKMCEEDEGMTSSRSKRKTPTIKRTCALLFAKLAMPLTAVLTTDLPLSMTCSMPDFAALDAALPPAVCAAVPEWAAA